MSREPMSSGDLYRQIQEAKANGTLVLGELTEPFELVTQTCDDETCPWCGTP